MTTETPIAWIGTEHTWHPTSVLHALPHQSVVLKEGDPTPWVVSQEAKRIEDSGDEPGFWYFQDVEERIAVLHVPQQPLISGQAVDLALLRRLPVKSIVIDQHGVAYQLWESTVENGELLWHSANGNAWGESHDGLIEEASPLRLAWAPEAS